MQTTSGNTSPSSAGGTNTSPSDAAPAAPAPGTPDAWGIRLMRISLEKAGRVTHQMTHEQLVSAYREFESEQRDAAKEKAEQDRREKLQRAADEAARRRREHVGRLREQLARQGVEVSGLSDDAVVEKSDELAKASQRREADVQRRRQAEILFKNAGCPDRHVAHLRTVDQNPKWFAVRDMLAGRVGDGYLVALLGNRGTGKTQLCVSVIYKACQQGLSGRYLKAMDLFRMIRATYSPVPKGGTAEREDDVIEALTEVDVLVIDEAHQRAGSDFEQNILTNLIDRRYDAMRSTILITNETKEQFAASAGNSVISRIHEAGDAIECDWPSYRKPGNWLSAPPKPATRAPSRSIPNVTIYGEV